MNTAGYSRSALVLLAAAACGFVGCHNTNYSYKRQSDSAVVKGVGSFNPVASSKFTVVIVNIDGQPAVNAAGYTQYVSPGLHVLLLQCDELGDLEDCMIQANFEASHTYSFAVDETGSILLDETAAADKPVSIGHWDFDSDDTAPEEPIESVDFGGAHHARPPQQARDSKKGGDHGSPPSHSGKPPSIPHEPRPSPGGGNHDGGGHTGGGNNSGGGGGHKK